MKCFRFAIKCFVLSLLSLVQAQPLDWRIVGGRNVTEGEARYMVSIRVTAIDDFFGFGQGHLCGGSLISKDLVISAAHCFPAQPDPVEYSVAMGNYDKRVLDENTFVSNVFSIVIHEKFDSAYFYNDIAILKLVTPVSLPHPTIELVGLINAPVNPNASCQITGWGRLAYNNGISPNWLQIATIPIIDTNSCNETTSYGGYLVSGMICAGFMEGEIDSCQGDSGGPLVCEDRLVGVVSFGDECAKANFPGVYTDVYHYLAWIENKTGIVPENSTEVTTQGNLTTEVTTQGNLTTEVPEDNGSNSTAFGHVSFFVTIISLNCLVLTF